MGHLRAGRQLGLQQPGRSPILQKGILYFDAGDNMRAIDCKTGKVLWTDQKKEENSMVSPAVITVGGRDILLSASEQAYLLPEGKKLKV